MQSAITAADLVKAFLPYLQTHLGVICDVCGAIPVGIRYTSPIEANSYDLCATCYLNEKNHKSFQFTAVIQPKWVEMVLKQNGNEAFHKRHYLQAVESYNQTLEITQDIPLQIILLSNKSECYLQLHQYEKAIEAAEMALTLDPSHQKSQQRIFRAKSGIETSQTTNTESNSQM